MNLPFNIGSFHPHNIIDTCSIWNLLSSKVLYSKAIGEMLSFYISKFVDYECLYKKRSYTSQTDLDLQKRLQEEKSNGQFKSFSLDIEDLLQARILENRKNIGKGEISSIILANKFNQAFLSDDRNARKIAEKLLDRNKIQRIEHLFGWLCFHSKINFNDKKQIISDFQIFKRAIGEEFINQIFDDVEKCKKMKGDK